MKKLYIPEIKDQLTLAADWTFTLYPETRNVKLGRKLGVCTDGDSQWGTSTYFSKWLDKPNGKEIKSVNDWDSKQEKWIWKVTYPVTLVKGTILQIDRIYIRKGKDMKDYSSITFWIKSGILKGARFWAHLKEVNEIVFNQCKQ